MLFMYKMGIIMPTLRFGAKIKQDNAWRHSVISAIINLITVLSSELQKCLARLHSLSWKLCSWLNVHGIWKSSLLLQRAFGHLFICRESSLPSWPISSQTGPGWFFFFPVHFCQKALHWDTDSLLKRIISDLLWGWELSGFKRKC